MVLVVMALTACTMTRVDPYEGVNRKFHGFNDKADQLVLKPIAKGYTVVTPGPVGRSVHHFFANLRGPTVFINQFLQGKGRLGLSDTGRFLVNSTLGIFGLFDVATSMGLEAHEEDFGQTFAVWGIGSGPYLVVPFWGPVTLREGVGDIISLFTWPVYYLDNSTVAWGLFGLGVVDKRAALLGVETLITGDRYLFIRETYLQRRNYLIHDGNVGDPFLDETE